MGVLLCGKKSDKKFFARYSHKLWMAGIDKLGKDLKITAKSPDGVIEGIETTNEWNAIGIQWHPEYLDDEPTNKIYNWLINS